MKSDIPLSIMNRPSPVAARASKRGAAMLAVLMFIMTTSIILTASVSLLSARSQQSERHAVAVQRHVTVGNSKAINQQYAFTWGLRENIVRTLSTASLDGWGGVSAAEINLLNPFMTATRPSTPGATNYPFNNIQKPITSDSGVFFTRTSAESDTSQTDGVTFYNYVKSYPASLLGDLLVLHKKPSDASFVVGDNIKVNGRVVIWDPTVNASGIRAQSCINLTKTGTNATQSTSAAAMLPVNFPAPVRTTAGYGGTASPTAVTDGTLNMANNPDFPAGSLRHTMENSGALGTTWANCSAGSNNASNVRTDDNSGSGTSDTQLKMEDHPVYPAPTTTPYGWAEVGKMNVLYIRLKNPTLKHLRIVNSVEQVVLQGQTLAADYTSAESLPPVIIWLEQATCRDIRFVGENSRRLILVTGKGVGATLYCGWSGTSLVGGGPLRWRLQWVNENRVLYLDAPTGNGVQITGGIRTDSTMDFTDNTNAVRFTLERETNPLSLLTMLPRDGWIEPYMLVR